MIYWQIPSCSLIQSFFNHYFPDVSQIPQISGWIPALTFTAPGPAEGSCHSIGGCGIGTAERLALQLGLSVDMSIK